MSFDVSAVEWAQVLATGIVTVLGALVGSFVMWKLVGPSVVRAGAKGVFGPAMLEWLFTPSVKTGEKLIEKKEGKDGTVTEKEVDEVLSPAEVLAVRMGKIVYMQTLSKLGVDGRKAGMVVGDIQAALANPDNPLAQQLAVINPKLLERALKDGDYVPIIMSMFAPQIKDYITNKLKSAPKQSITSSGVSGNVKW